jgi:hypothetical protein
MKRALFWTWLFKFLICNLNKHLSIDVQKHLFVVLNKTLKLAGRYWSINGHSGNWSCQGEFWYYYLGWQFCISREGMLSVYLFLLAFCYCSSWCLFLASGCQMGSFGVCKHTEVYTVPTNSQRRSSDNQCSCCRQFWKRAVECCSGLSSDPFLLWYMYLYTEIYWKLHYIII